MSYDRWKTRSLEDEDMRAYNAPLVDEPGEQEAQQEHEDNVSNLLESPPPRHYYTAEDAEVLDAQFELALQGWIDRAMIDPLGIDNLGTVRRQIDAAISLATAQAKTRAARGEALEQALKIKPAKRVRDRRKKHKGQSTAADCPPSHEESES